jgi:cytochrome b561
VHDHAAASDAPIRDDLSHSFRYDRRTILFHWITALLVALLWAIAQIIDFFPAGPLRVDARSVHISLGVLLTLILALRVTWRARGDEASWPPRAGFMDEAAHLGQVLLYLLAILAVISGFANAWIRGDSIFNLFALPAPGPDARALRRLVAEAHSYLTNGLLILALGHSALALFHHYVLRDRVLWRMTPWQAKGGA